MATYGASPFAVPVGLDRIVAIPPTLAEMPSVAVAVT